MIYGLYFTIVAVLSSLSKRVEKFYLTILLTFIFIGLSYPAGGDWIGYFINYDCQINNVCLDSFYSFEIGYQMLVNIFGSLGFISINIFQAIIFVVCLASFAKKFDNSVLIVFFVMSMMSWSLYTEAVRQGMAISIFYLALYELQQRRFKKYIFMVFLASLMHITALITLFMIIPYLSKSLSKFIVRSIIALAICFALFPFQILNFILDILPINSSANIKLNFYLNNGNYMPQVSIGLGLIFDLLITIILISTIRKLKFQISKDNKFLMSCIIGTSIFIGFSVIIGRFMPVLTRIGWYFIPVIIIILYSNIGNSFYFTKVESKNRLTNYFIFLYFLMQIIRPLTYSHSYYGIIHQKTIFQMANRVDDVSLRNAAAEKCNILKKLGYDDLCFL